MINYLVWKAHTQPDLKQGFLLVKNLLFLFFLFFSRWIAIIPSLCNLWKCFTAILNHLHGLMDRSFSYFVKLTKIVCCVHAWQSFSQVGRATALPLPICDCVCECVFACMCVWKEIEWFSCSCSICLWILFFSIEPWLQLGWRLLKAFAESIQKVSNMFKAKY